MDTVIASPHNAPSAATGLPPCTGGTTPGSLQPFKTIVKFLFDIFPVLIFFVVFKMYNIYAATAAAIVATFAQAAWSW